MRICYFFVIALGVAASCVDAASAQNAVGSRMRTENVLVVTLDGFRWQEFFAGADEDLINKQFGGVRDLERIRQSYLRKSADERRKVLLPFFWNTIAKQGQIFGDQTRKAPTKLTNGLKFSYPGYSEILCGFADPTITSNAKKVNPNLSVLEFLHDKPAYRNKVAVFGTWDVFASILRTERNGIKIHTDWNPVKDDPLTERQKAMNDLLPKLPRYWNDNAFDFVTMEYAREHLRRHKPRVMFIALGETDEWGHGRRYDLYLDAAKNSDQFLASLWNELQTMPEYKGKTSLIVTTDHGRGDTRVNWIDHGKNVPSAEFIWIAVLGPDTPALGVRENVETTQSQVAASVAHLLGENFNGASEKSALPLAGIRLERR